MECLPEALLAALVESMTVSRGGSGARSAATPPVDLVVDLAVEVGSAESRLWRRASRVLIEVLSPNVYTAPAQRGVRPTDVANSSSLLQQASCVGMKRQRTVSKCRFIVGIGMSCSSLTVYVGSTTGTTTRRLRVKLKSSSVSFSHGCCCRSSSTE
jgi:hypothetical protein